LLHDGEKVMRETVEVVVDDFGGDKDLGMAGGIGGATPYAATSFTTSPPRNR
jgi:hypothetical protein